MKAQNSILNVIEKLQEKIFERSKSIAEKKLKLAQIKTQQEATRNENAGYRNLIKQAKMSKAQKKLLEPIAKARTATENALYANVL